MLKNLCAGVESKDEAQELVPALFALYHNHRVPLVELGQSVRLLFFCCFL